MEYTVNEKHAISHAREKMGNYTDGQLICECNLPRENGDVIAHSIAAAQLLSERGREIRKIGGQYWFCD
jgi:hypothetical protein